MPSISSCNSAFANFSSPFTSNREVLFERLNSPELSGVIPASRLEIRPAPKMVSSGIRELDLLTQGLPRGCLTEVCGASSSGRTTLLLAVLAASTQRNEVCALVDVSDALDPVSAQAAGVDFEKLLWARCSPAKKSLAGKKAAFGRTVEGPIEQALRVTDLLLQSGGFGLVIIDLSDIPLKMARRIPLTSWFRFRRAVENTSTILLVTAQAPCTHTCALLLLKLRAKEKRLSAVSSRLSAQKKVPAHSQLLGELEIEGELLRSRLERKPMQSAGRFSAASLRIG